MPADVSTIDKLKCLLQQCRHKRNVEQAKQLHAYVCSQRLQWHTVLGNYLVSVLVECGCLFEAQQVFNGLSLHNVYSWTSLISGYVHSGESEHAFHLYFKMQKDHVQPNNYTFVALLKACSRLDNVERKNALHADIVKMGLDNDLFIGNSLVDMYGKIGLLADAHQVHKKLFTHDVVSWNVLIAGYADHGLGEEALSCFEKMQLEDVGSDNVTYVFCLKACGSIGDFERGRSICAEITKKGMENDILIGNTMVDMHAKCGLLAEACSVFNKLPIQDAILWNTLIAAYAEQALWSETWDCFERMQLEGFPPDDATFLYSLKACSIEGSIEQGHLLCTEIFKRGLEKDLVIANTVIDMYSKCSSLADAHKMLEKCPIRDVVSWNALIAGYADQGHGEEALRCVDQMQLDGTPPDGVTFPCSLKACGTIGATERGKLLCAEITKRGLEKDIFISSAMVDMLAKCGSIAEAHHILIKLPVRSKVVWNALVAGYAEHGFGEEALNCFEQMQHEGVFPDVVTFSGSLKACSIVKAPKTGHKIHAELSKRGLDSDLFVCSSLIDMYVKCGCFAESWQMLDKLPVRDGVSWNALLAGYAEKGLGEEILNCFEKMHLESVCPVVVTHACSLKACGITGALETGHRIHAEILKQGLEKYHFVANTLVEMYGKCGSLVEGHNVFEKLPLQNVVSWNILIKGYGENHEGTMVVECFEKMQERGVKPDAITFTCLLGACSHSNLVQKGHEYFHLMRDHGIKPTWDHFACMVDLLARSGHVYEADRLIGAMQHLPSEGTLRALLSACKIHEEVELGLRCFQQLVQANQDDASAYLLMADIYASGGMLIDASRIEEMRKQVRAEKKPASASIEVNRELLDFVVGGRRSESISSMLQLVNLSMKYEGHVPNIESVLQESKNS